jgi:small subunit ribosomal protein S18
MTSRLSFAQGGTCLPTSPVPRADSQIIKPAELSTTSLHAKRPPRVKTPLLGPRSSIAKAQDPFYITRTNPIDHALNPNFVLSFLNPLGRIKKRQETGLTRRTQRKVDKMVKRARGMGVIPIFTNVGSADGMGKRRL